MPAEGDRPRAGAQGRRLARFCGPAETGVESAHDSLALIGAKVITVQAQEQRPAQAPEEMSGARSRTEATIRARAVASISTPSSIAQRSSAA